MNKMKMWKVMLQKTHQTRKYLYAIEKIPKFNRRRVFNKAVGPGKNPKLINIGPKFIPNDRVAP